MYSRFKESLNISLSRAISDSGFLFIKLAKDVCFFFIAKKKNFPASNDNTFILYGDTIEFRSEIGLIAVLN